MKLYLVRHGETDWNKEGRMQGRKGVGLNEVGLEQVKMLGEELKDKGLVFDVCYASPLKRAVETAEVLVGGKCEIVYDERLMERGFGVFEGRTMEEFWDSVGVNDIMDRRSNYSEKDLEPIKNVLERAKSFLNDIKKEYINDERVLVVSHGALLRALHFEIVGYNDETDFHDFSFKNAEMREYDIDSAKSLRKEK